MGSLGGGGGGTGSLGGGGGGGIGSEGGGGGGASMSAMFVARSSSHVKKEKVDALVLPTFNS